MKPNVRRKNKDESWEKYMAHVEGRIAEASMADAQALCRKYGVSIEGLALAITADVNKKTADEICAAMDEEGHDYEDS